MGGMERLEALIALNRLEHVGPIRLRQLLRHFDDDPVAVLHSPAEVLRTVHGVGAETADSISRWRELADLEGELRRIQQSGVRVLCDRDPEYPPLLREIYDPPIVLYVRGTLLASDRNAVALVGSRLTTAYGIETARRFGYQLAYAGVAVVSGGARGIDTAAHQGALSAKGRTIAVLGTGINRVFPPENADLFHQIAERGAVITQFPFDRPADKQTFPIRNRIVAGMTLGTAVIEANLSSGALITADFAVEYGRQVFAVPGRIDSPRSRGCHELIKKGAKLCEGIEDILGDFEYLFPPSNRPDSETETGATVPLGAAEQALYSVLGQGEMEADELIRASGLSTSAANVALFSLEMKRLVRQAPGRRFTRIGPSGQVR
jgi:DNA processing protein